MKIIILYHSPCLDGSFSLLTLVLFIKYGLRTLDFQLLYDKIISFNPITMIFPLENPAKEKIEEEFKDFNEKELLFEILNKAEIHPDIYYYPIKPSHNNENMSNVLKSLNSFVKPLETIIILLDYYAETLENIIKLTQISSKLIIIDHHQSFFDIIPLIKPPNLLYHGHITQSAAPLTYSFCEKLFGDILPAFLKRSLLERLLFIEDHDLRTKIYPTTPFITTALFSLIKDQNIRTNPLLLYSLLRYNIETLIALGKPMVLNREKEVIKALSTKKIVKITIEKEEYKGFLCIIKDHSLINDLAETLAEESIKEKMDNLGIVLLVKNEGYRVCLRGVNSIEKSPILAIAGSIKGGGHKYAAGGWINKRKLKTWLNY